jgi:hypothetical protein
MRRIGFGSCGEGSCWLWPLLGCATVRDAAAPHSLSDADRAAVGKALYAALEKLDSPQFSFKGAQTSDGRIYVCGWVSDKGAYSDKPPFIGTLFGDQFVIETTSARAMPKGTTSSMNVKS